MWSLAPKSITHKWGESKLTVKLWLQINVTKLQWCTFFAYVQSCAKWPGLPQLWHLTFDLSTFLDSLARRAFFFLEAPSFLDPFDLGASSFLTFFALGFAWAIIALLRDFSMNDKVSQPLCFKFHCSYRLRVGSEVMYSWKMHVVPILAFRKQVITVGCFLWVASCSSE